MSPKAFGLIVVAFYLVAPMSAGKQPGEDRRIADCRMVEQALSDRAHLLPGILRSDVEKFFVREGGFQTAASTTYAYSKCRFIHVDVDFELIRPSQIDLLPNDRVTKVSKLYIAYETKD